jgi:hypothetical protein
MDLAFSCEDIPDEDAIFFASMETACALCQAPAGQSHPMHATRILQTRA